MADEAFSLWLMLALPCTEVEFVERLSGRDNDYLAKFDLPDAAPAERAEHWRAQWRGGVDAMVGRPLRALAERAERLGCTVVPRATLVDLRAAAGQARIIVLVAHWKDAAFSAGDFLPEFERHFAGHVASRTHPLAQWLRQATQPRRRFLFWRDAGPHPRDAVRRSLDAKTDGPVLLEMAQTTAARRRDLLDGWFADCLRPGNRLELFDGLHDKEAVAAALSGFDGVIDLTICTSTYLGDHISTRSRQQTRTVQFLNLQEPAEAALRLAHVLQAFMQHPASPEQYLHDRMTVGALFPLIVEDACEQRSKDRYERT